ncbi:MAG: SMC-Scp complex subunit ScpB [Candidatus Omnitrophota bacterium]
MTRDEAKKVVEVLLFVSEKPLVIDNIVKILDGFDKESIRSIIEELNGDYAQTGRAFSAVEVGGGFQILTDPFYAPWVRKLLLKDKKHRLSAPSLETLAIIAYKQPVTRADIEAIRGVNIEGVLETVLERNLVKIVGRREIPGRPFVYGTTKTFLTQFGLNSLDDLPKLKDFDEKDIQLGRDELIKKSNEIEGGEEVPNEENQESVEGVAREDR